MDNARFGKAFFVSLASLAIAGVALLPAQSTPQGKVPNAKGPDFNKDIQPLLREKCMPCHGDVQAAGGLKLTQLKLAMTGGNSGSRGLVPHDPNASTVIQRVSTTNVDLVMPPNRSGKTPLTGAQVAMLRSWVQSGPSWPDAGADTPAGDTHWSLQPLRKPAVPAGKAPHVLDRFLDAKLSAKGLAMGPATDRLTLIRRVTFDLIGLPPTDAEIKAFVGDKKPGAYERVVDRLLASPRYGERWARHWLDTIHYADSHGAEHDMGRKYAWPFRDYVIDTFNKDVSYSRFVREQLAADVLFPNRPDLTPAMGYLSAGNFDLSAYYTAPIPFEILDRDDMVNQAMSTFVSTTANCARCHDHKFDPIPTTDYWSLQAVFAGVIKGDVTYEDRPGLAEQRSKWTKLKEVADSKDANKILAAEHKPVVETFVSALKSFGGWKPLVVQKAAGVGGATLTFIPDGTISAGGKLPLKDTYTIVGAAGAGRVAAVRIDALTSSDLPKGGPGRSNNGSFLLTEVSVDVIRASGKREKTKIVRTSADHSQKNGDAPRAADGLTSTGWGISPEFGKDHHIVFAFDEPVVLGANDKLEVVVDQNDGGSHLLGKFRVSTADGPSAILCAIPPSVSGVLKSQFLDKTAETELATFAIRETAAAGLASLPAQKRVYVAARSADVADVGFRTIDKPREIRVLERGELSRPKQVVGPGALSVLPQLSDYFKRRDMSKESQRRAALAEWFVDRRNPLTWRSIVNRVWHYHFGKGIVDTPGDFGRMGGAPSHPELLDYLAVWFRDDANGSFKKLHRLMVTSRAYQQTSVNRLDAAKIDSDNRLLWKANRLRLDADQYRDAALQTAGRIDFKMGGPGVNHFKMGPGPQMTPALDYAAYDWESPEANRRSVYRTVWRAIPDPFMDSMDFPDLALLSPTRGTSVSALQALTLYNNNFVLSCSRALAKRVSDEGGLVPQQVERAAELSWGRHLTKAERKVLFDMAHEHGLEATCRVILNANAFLFID